MSFAKRLKDARIAQGYTSQKSLADKLGISSGTIGNYESGVRPKPEQRIIDRIAEFLNIDAADLRDGPELSPEQYGVFCERISDALDHTSSDDFEALGLNEKELRTAIRQSKPIREDRASELAFDLGIVITDIIDGTNANVKQLRRLRTYYNAFMAAADGADQKDIEDAIRYLEYRKHVNREK